MPLVVQFAYGWFAGDAADHGLSSAIRCVSRLILELIAVNELYAYKRDKRIYSQAGVKR